MNLISKIFVFLAFVHVTYIAQTQTSPVSEDDRINDIIETVIEDSETNSSYNTSFEYLRYYQEHPVDLNIASFEGLQALGILSDIQIKALLEHKEKNGSLISIYELQAIRHFDLETINKLLPYVTIKADLEDWHGTVKDILTSGSHQFYIRGQQTLEKQKGFTLPYTLSNRYMGSPLRLYTRYRYAFGKQVSYGFTAEKDPGEEFFRGTQKQGFDFYSAHLYISTKSILKDIAIGDYELKLGQGLIIWSGFGFSKTPYVINIKKSGQVIKPYTSVNESNYFRGIATRWGIKNWRLTTFFSHKTIDGNITELDTVNEETLSISTFQDVGYHRTTSEIEDKGALRQTVFGSYLSYHYSSKLKVGMTFSNTLLSADLIKRSVLPYNQFEFTGNSLMNFGLDYSYIYQNIHLFGEMAMSDNEAKACLNGGIMSLDPK